MIEEIPESAAFGLMSHTGYKFTLQKKESQWTGLKQHEYLLLASLFQFDGLQHDSVMLSELKNKFFRCVPKIAAKLYETLIDNGYYIHNPLWIRNAIIAAGSVVMLIAPHFHKTVAPMLATGGFSYIIGCILSGLIVIFYGRFAGAHTPKGCIALMQILGFKEFLNRVDTDRMDRLEKTPALFEKYLPYAMALGVEKHWAKTFDDIYKQPPTWYRGTYMASFVPSVFMGNLHQMSQSAATTMRSTPSGRGGGSAGGGFGGGGGRGF